MDSKLRYWLGKEGGLAVNVLAYGFGFVLWLFLFNGGYASRLEIPNLLSFFFFNHQSLLTLCAEMTAINGFFFILKTFTILTYIDRFILSYL